MEHVTNSTPAYPHAEVLISTPFTDDSGWYGAVQSPEAGTISVFASKESRSGPARTCYYFTRDGVEYSLTERRFRSLPRGASIVARNWARDVIRGLDHQTSLPV